jgi:peroxiredoxin
MPNNSKPIASAVAKMKKESDKSPSPVAEIFNSWVAALDKAGIPTSVLPPGSNFPDGDLLDVDGKPTSFKRTVNGKPAAVVFYRGAWCPYCNLALSTYQRELLPKLNKLGVMLVAVSPQEPDGSMTMKEKHKLDFAVLSDPGNQIAEQLGIITVPPAKVQTTQKKFGLDLTAINADHTANLPMPTVAIVDDKGKLVWIDVHPNHTTRTEPDEVLKAIKAHLIKFD